MGERVTSPRFVGRQAELTELQAAFDRAAGGRASVVIVSGDAGVGKTRLVNELGLRVAEAGGQVCRGGCVPLDDGVLPNAPLAEILRGLARRLDPDALGEVLGPGAGMAAALVPELADLPGTRSEPEPFARTLEALLGVTGRLGRLAPALVVLEDLHWADGATRDLLGFLARNLSDERVLVVGTVRADAMETTSTLRARLSELGRLERVQRVEIGGFDRPTLLTQMTAILGEEPDLGLLGAIWARSEGNAFMTEELLAAGGDATTLPASLRELVTSRVRALPEATQRMLCTAAVIGRHVDHELLERCAGLDPEALEAALLPALSDQILVLDPEAERYSFRHALIREVLEADLLPGRRRRQHRTVAEVLAPQVEDGRQALAGALARHWQGAGEPARALAASVTAVGVLATSPADAHAELEHSLALWAEVAPEERPPGLDHADLLQRAGEAAFLAGGPERAAALSKAALAEIDPVAEPVRAAVLEEELATDLYAAGRSPESFHAAARAVALLPEGTRSTGAVEVLSTGALSALFRRDLAEARELAERALALADELGVPMVATLARVVAARVRSLEGFHDEAVERTREAVDLARAGHEPNVIALAYLYLIVSQRDGGRNGQALESAQEGLAWARREGLERSWEAYLGSLDAELMLTAGHWEQAEGACLRFAGVEVIPLAAVRLLLVRAEVALLRGRVESARPLVEAAARLAPGPQDSLHWGLLLVSQAGLALATGDWGAARAAGVHVGLVRDGSSTVALRLAVVAARALVEEALDDQAHGRELDRDSTHAAMATLLDQARQAALPLGGEGALPSPEASACVLEIEAQQTRLEGPSDPDLWAAAAQRWESLDHPYEAAIDRCREGEAALGRRDSADRAVSRLRESYQVATRLGATALAAEIEAVGRRSRIDVAQVQTLEPARLASGELGLTAREAEVLVLLTDGHTNRSIATRLYISEKTASVHVSNILRKLGVRSRVEAAAVAQRAGLEASAD